MMQRVIVMDGFLIRGMLRFELTRRDQGPRDVFDFRGHGFLQGNSLNLLRYGEWGPVSEYIIASQPTEESAQWAAGYEHAEQQKIKRAPVGKHEAFYRGWAALWSERRPFKFLDEIRAERNKRRNERKTNHG